MRTPHLWRAGIKRRCRRRGQLLFRLEARKYDSGGVLLCSTLARCILALHLLLSGVLLRRVVSSDKAVHERAVQRLRLAGRRLQRLHESTESAGAQRRLVRRRVRRCACTVHG
jgi:hypothetical protein